MMFCKFVVIFALIFIPNFTQACVTPNGFQGQCTLLNDCAPLLNYLKEVSSQNRSPNQQYLSSLLCDNNEQLICCASNDTVFQTNHTNLSGTTHRPDPTPFTAAPTPGVILNRYEIDDDLRLPDPDSSECGRDRLTDRVLGGNETNLGEYPWLALLEYREPVSGERSFECIGSLIHKRYVITTGYCLIGAIIKNYGPLVNVRLGEHNLTSAIDCSPTNSSDCADDVINVGIKYTVLHPLYNRTTTGMKNDIGLIRLAENIKTTEYIQPICFPTPDIYSPDGTRLVIAGWGRTMRETRSNVKQHVSLPIVNYEECRKAIGALEIDEARHICAGGEFEKDSCSGDNGGPLMVNYNGNWYIEGITSMGSSNTCGTLGKPSIYTRVNWYENFVLNTIEYEF